MFDLPAQLVSGIAACHRQVVTPDVLAHLQAEKQTTVSAGYAECEDLIAQYRDGKLELQAGCNLEQSLEALVTGKLNAIRETASQVGCVQL